ncbi:ATP-dependent helicase [Tautonia sociabilis]|uniref:DNA 3'-5' helicase n=1 Tax=Tautonia sociabilis TaxID=2080755 RepID=A0A432MQG9_9BACT|nr:UvrD-helicase domain-containing protein [Tautonia sociabilis]RUL89743.1 DNA helicase UvrD [Tautonia sociabilis]
MDLFRDLTPAQREAVSHVDGPMLVLAGAGSGKTRVITRRVAHLIRSGIPGRRILALTFTNKAAGEMRERIASLVPDHGVWVGTFHALCARLLREFGPRIGLDRGFTIYDQSDRLRVIKSVLDQLDLSDAGVAPEKVESAISRAKNDMLDPETFLSRRGDGGDHVSAVVGRVYKAYQLRLLESAAVDFDDLLVHVVSLLKEDRELRARLDDRYRYILVDEYQDTNLAQYAIVRALSVDAPNLCVTGDPDQSIYGWRGANLNNILEFEHDYPGCKVVRLERNYRSTKNILRVADHVIRHNRRRKPKALTTENPEGEPVELATFASEADEAQAVASTIADLVRDGGYSFGEIAVFVRVTALTRGFESAFRSLAIPYQVVGGVSFYERVEVKDALAYLSLLNNPKDDVAFLRAVNAPPRGIGKVSLDRLQSFARDRGLPMLASARDAASVAGLTPKARSGLRDFALLMDELAALSDHSAEEVIRRLLHLSGYREYWAKQPKGDGEDRVANLDELVSAARQFDLEHPEATILDFLADVTLSSAVDRWKDEGGAVTLMTLHAAKGLEFPVVFIVGLEQGLLPHSRASDNDAELEEERRLFFVGITRAQKELRLSHCRVREFRGQRSVAIPSQFLSELPEGPIRYRDQSGMDGEGSLSIRRSAPRPPERPEPRPGGISSGRFRVTTAAALGQGGASASPEGPASDLDAFRPGLLVLHPQYGLGKITSIDGAGPNRKGRIAFAVGGERTFVLAKAPLRLVKGA